MSEDIRSFQAGLANALRLEAETRLCQRTRCEFGDNPDYWWECRAAEQLFFAAARVTQTVASEEGNSLELFRERVVSAFLANNQGSGENWPAKVQTRVARDVVRFVTCFGRGDHPPAEPEA